MKPEIRKCETPDDLNDAIHIAVERLSKGEMIGLPSEQGYVAVQKAAVRFEEEDLLNETRFPHINLPEVDTSKAKTSDHSVRLEMLPSVLLLRGAEELADFVAPVPARGMKLLKRFQDGSIELILPSPENRRNNDFRCRVSSGKGLKGVHRFSSELLIASSVHSTGGDFANPPVESCCSLVNLLPKCLNYVIDTGEIGGACFSAVVRCQSEGVQVIQSNNVAESMIMERSGPCILFVCTGNTCRSPMAEAICRELLTKRLQCTSEELQNRGVEVVSAGIATNFGSPASADAVVLLEKEGVDLSDHQSQPVTSQLLDRVDYIFTMTSQHREVVLHHRPDLENCTSVLGVGRRDIPDPIGGGMEVYRQCKEAIVAGLEEHLETIIAGI